MPLPGPTVTAVLAEDLRTILVTFEREMVDNADLVNPAAYLLTGGATVDLVTRVDGTRVRLRTDRDLSVRRVHFLTVEANP